MRRFFETIAKLSSDDNFVKFQNKLTHNFYDVLGQGYAANENEVALVKRLVESANGSSYGPVNLRANMLHGSRSYVEFNYMDKPVTKEMGDMAIISVVTRGKERLLQKICIIQNKKDKAKRWSIDLEQLFLLKNFPPFTGNKGIFKNCRDVAFRNTSGCLGAFGLLRTPGEMIFASAGLVSEFIHDKKSLSASDISLSSGIYNNAIQENQTFFPYWLPFNHFHPKEWYHIMREVAEMYGYPPGAPIGQPNDFLGNSRFGRDLYDFVRSWTQLSIGEITCINDKVTNIGVDAFANFLIRSAGFGDIVHTPGDNMFGDSQFGRQLAVFMMHFNIERE